MAADYEDFRESMKALEEFIERCDTKEIEGQQHITIDESNVDEFRAIMEHLTSIASSEDGYADEVIEYLREIDKRIIDRDMVAKFIPLFAALQALATPSTDVRLDDWIFEIDSITNADMDCRFGKVIGITPDENGNITYRIKAVLANNEIIEWETPNVMVIPEMEQHLKKYQDRYTKIF